MNLVVLLPIRIGTRRYICPWTIHRDVEKPKENGEDTVEIPAKILKSIILSDEGQTSSQ